MTDLISHLRRSGQAHLNPQTSERIKQQLMIEFAALPFEPQRSVKARYWFRVERLLARPFSFSVVSLVIVILVAVISAEADAAKPGDALYPWDRGLERVRLTFTIPSDARAAFQTKLTNERAAEQAALQAIRKHGRSNQASDVRGEDQVQSQSLEQALETIDRQQDIRTADERGNSDEALRQVEERLVENQERQAEQKNDKSNVNAPDSTKQQDSTERSVPKLTKVEVRVRGGIATIQVRLDGVSSTFTLPWTNVKKLVSEIAHRTGVSETSVRRFLRVRRFGGDTNVLVAPKDRLLPLSEEKQNLRQVPPSTKDATPSRP